MYTVYFRKTARSEERVFLTSLPNYNLADRAAKRLRELFDVAETRIEQD